ncbi:MAG: preprotein translocase subunit YajC [Parvibaculales bacterium]
MISIAYAQTASSGSGGDFITSLFPLLLVFAILYFLIIRPQQKRQKLHRAMVQDLQRGDNIVTQGGMLGKITKVEDNECEVEIAEGTRIRVIKSTILDVRSKTEPRK